MYLLQLEDCVVVLPMVPGALHCSNLKNCLIICGPVSGSCLLEKLTNCQVILAVRQLRIHHADACDFFIHTSSRPIIEYCTGLRFGPYMLQYKQLREDVNTSKIPWTNIEKWREVDDFRWLRKQQSPNWALLQEAAAWAKARRENPVHTALLEEESSRIQSLDLHVFQTRFLL